MTNLWVGNEVVGVKVSADDTIGSIAQVTHYTVREVLEIINGFIEEDRKKYDASRKKSKG